MPLNVAFRWSSPNISVSDAQQQSMVQGLKGLGEGIATARQRSYQKEQDARRNKIEDEDRSRRMAEEDRRKQAYAEAADLMRKRQVAIDQLKGQREQIVQQIQQLKAEIGEM